MVKRMYAQVSQDDAPSYSRKRQKRRPVSLKAMRGQTLLKRDEVKSLVRRSIGSRSEKKIFIKSDQNLGLVNASVSSGFVPFSLALTPNPNKGTDDNERVGDRIFISRHYVRGHVNLTPYSLATNTGVPPYYVKIWVAKYKHTQSNNFANTNCLNNFFQGNGAALGFNGNMRDIESDNYSDAWIIYASKTLKLGATNAINSGSTNTAAYLDASQMSVPFYFDLTKYMKGRLGFLDSSTVPQEKQMWLIMQVVQADGTPFSTTACVPCEVHYNYTCHYTDS